MPILLDTHAIVNMLAKKTVYPPGRFQLLLFMVCKLTRRATRTTM